MNHLADECEYSAHNLWGRNISNILHPTIWQGRNEINISVK